jgi:hypothetical protein
MFGMNEVSGKLILGTVMCSIFNLIDFRYWGCDCEYVYPYFLTINNECKKHD